MKFLAIKFFKLFFFILVYSLSNSAKSAPPTPTSLSCSVTDNGKAVINEINSNGNFVEIYLLQSADILDWAVYKDDVLIQSLGQGVCTINGLVTPDDTAGTTHPAGTFIVCSSNFNPSNNEVLLVDKGGTPTGTTVIDYISYGTPSPSAKWTVPPACGTLYPEHSASNKDIARIPDGSGPLSDNDDNSTPGTTNGGGGGGGASNNCTSFSITVPTLTACKPDSSVSISCGSDLQGDQTFKFWSSYMSPSSGNEPIKVNDTSISTSSPGTDITLNFTNGDATFKVQYNDAGQVKLNATFDNNGLALSGDSTFVSKPVTLVTYTNDANADCVSADANCSVFKKAGETFNLKVNAACWTSDSDTNFTDNPVTPNFELAGISTNHMLVSPAAGASGSIGVSSFNFSLLDNGTHIISQSVSEVGVFTFGLTSPTNYFSESISTVSSSEIGRFTPDHFMVSGVLNDREDLSCSSSPFTYMDEPFQLALTITAQNLSNGTTQNYATANSFAKLDPTTADWLSIGSNESLGIGAINSATTPLTSRLVLDSAPSGSWIAGVGALSANFYLSRPLTSIADSTWGPYDNLTIGVAPQDEDGIKVPTASLDLDADNNSSFERVLITGTKLRYGRIEIQNAHGSELIDLPASLTAQYWNGTNWVLNTDDQCSTVSLSLADPIATDGLVPSELCVWDNGSPGNSGLGCSTAGTATNKFNEPPPVTDGGNFNLNFKAPGNGNTGALDTTVDVNNYLKFNWKNTGDINPTARHSFGIYKGNSKQIYFREVY